MTPSPRRAGRVWVTPKAAGMLEGAAGAPGTTEDEKLLEAALQLLLGHPRADARVGALCPHPGALERAPLGAEQPARETVDRGCTDSDPV